MKKGLKIKKIKIISIEFSFIDKKALAKIWYLSWNCGSVMK